MFQRFSDQARRVVVLAQEEARMLSHNSIGTEHILLGLIRVGDSVAAQVLVRTGTDLSRVRARVIQLIAVGPPADVIAVGEADARLTELAEQVRQLSEEVERLRGLLHRHGLDPGEGTA